jgi:Uma2 family endonuclease
MESDKIVSSPGSEDRPYEIVNGETVIKAEGTAEHSYIIDVLAKQFRSYFEKHGCRVFAESRSRDFGAILNSKYGNNYALFLNNYYRKKMKSPTNIYFPDVFVDCLPWAGEDDKLHVPSIVVEVLSNSTWAADTGIKYQVYGLCGVKEYWIIDPDECTISLNLNQDSKGFLLEHKYIPNRGDIYSQDLRCERVNTFISPSFPDLQIDIMNIFDYVN